VLDKAKYSAFESTLNSPIVSYRIVSYRKNGKQNVSNRNVHMKRKAEQCKIRTRIPAQNRQNQWYCQHQIMLRTPMISIKMPSMMNSHQAHGFSS